MIITELSNNFRDTIQNNAEVHNIIETLNNFSPSQSQDIQDLIERIPISAVGLSIQSLTEMENIFQDFLTQVQTRIGVIERSEPFLIHSVIRSIDSFELLESMHTLIWTDIDMLLEFQEQVTELRDRFSLIAGAERYVEQLNSILIGIETRGGHSLIIIIRTIENRIRQVSPQWVYTMPNCPYDF